MPEAEWLTGTDPAPMMDVLANGGRLDRLG